MFETPQTALSSKSSSFPRREHFLFIIPPHDNNDNVNDDDKRQLQAPGGETNPRSIRFQRGLSPGGKFSTIANMTLSNSSEAQDFTVRRRLYGKGFVFVCEGLGEEAHVERERQILGEEPAARDRLPRPGRVPKDVLRGLHELEASGTKRLAESTLHSLPFGFVEFAMHEELTLEKNKWYTTCGPPEDFVTSPRC